MSTMGWGKRDAKVERGMREEPSGIGPVESVGLALLFLGVILVRPFVSAWDWLLP